MVAACPKHGTRWACGGPLWMEQRFHACKTSQNNGTTKADATVGDFARGYQVSLLSRGPALAGGDGKEHVGRVRMPVFWRRPCRRQVGRPGRGPHYPQCSAYQRE